MIYLRLFLSFLKIGAISFGGGMGMIPVMLDETVGLRGWLTEEAFYNLVAVSESTPGPIAVNMATYVGSTVAGFFGALIATVAVVLPAFVIILLIAALLKNFLKNRYVNGAVYAVSPVIISMLFINGLLIAAKTVFPAFTSGITVFNWKQLILIAVLFISYGVYKKVRKENFNPILLIVIAGVAGAIFL